MSRFSKTLLCICLVLALASCRHRGAATPNDLPPSDTVEAPDEPEPTVETELDPSEDPNSAPPISGEPEPWYPVEPQSAIEAPEVEVEVELEPAVFTRYPTNVVHSPITASVIQSIREIASEQDEAARRVFMKLGASESADRRSLYCFGGGGGGGSPFYEVELGAREDLSETLEHFRSGDVRGRNPFSRKSRATVVGRSAVWAITGNRPPLVREMGYVNPAWAVVTFGINDLNLGSTPRDAVWGFQENLSQLLDRIIEAGVVPIVMGVSPRNDSKIASRWNATFAAVQRGLAEARQVPYVDLQQAMAELPGQGVVADGVHGTVFTGDRGAVQPCVFTEDALQFHYNVRNLETLDALDRARRALADGTVSVGEPVPPLQGVGTLESPFLIDSLPFTHVGDTSSSDQRLFDEYPSCGDGQNESGPEAFYRLDIEEDQRLRILLFANGPVDADLHILDETGTAESCAYRDGRMFEGTLGAGTHLLSIDTFVGRDHRERVGEYMLLVTQCDSRDRSSRSPHSGVEEE